MIVKNSRKFLLILPFILLLLIDYFYIKYNYDMLIIPSAKTLLLSTIIIYCLFSILIFITKSINKANIILYIFFFFILIINQIKIFYMQEPIYIYDLYHIFNIRGLVEMTNGTLIQCLKKALIPFVFQIVIFSFFISFSYKCKSCLISKRNYFILFIPIIFLGILFVPNRFTNVFILSNFFDNNKIDDFNYSVDDKSYYAIKGVLAGIYGQYLENQVFKPSDYDEKQLDNILNKTQKKKDNSDINPNIILFVSESFWDIEQLEEIEFDKEITLNFREISQNSHSKLFNMISPSYGGLSANVGWSLLVGANPSFYSKAYIPYLRLYNDRSYYNRNSIVKELKENGYITKVLSADSPTLYNCDRFYNYMEFDSIKYFDNIAEEHKKGYYVSDEYITSQLIKDLESNKDNGTPTFHFVFTMQAHMPYLLAKYDNYDIEIKNSKFSKEINEVLLSYAQGVYDADQQLKRLYEFLLDFEKPTILVFLGDHLPYLSTTNGENVIDKLEFFNTKEEKINLYRKYNTKSLIVSNFALEHEKIKYLGPDLLMSYVLEKSNLDLSPYYEYLNNSRTILPTFNRYITVDNFGNIKYTESNSKELLSVYNLRKNLQYKLFF